MPIYQDADGTLYYEATALDSADTPAGWTLLTDAQAAAAMAPTQAQLLAYADTKRQAVADGGITINVGTPDAPVNCAVDTTAAGRVNLSGLVQMAALNPSLTQTWYQSAGPAVLTATQIVSLGMQTGAFISAAYAAEASVVAGITAGSITTYAQIDAFAWPTV